MTHWLEGAVIYELYADKFAGGFRGLTAKLDYFNRLGARALHVLPFYPSPMIDDGYDVSDYRNIRADLGTLEDFEDFVKAAGERELRVIVDLVLNHVSREHPWFREKKDYFLWSKTGRELAGAINAFPHLKPSNWIFDESRGEYYFATFYPEQPDLNWDNPAVLREFLEIMQFWLGRGVAGFRLDAASYLVKREGTTSKGLPETHAVLKKLRNHIEEQYPDAILLAETHDPIPKTKTYFGNDDECHLLYNFPLAEAMFLKLIAGDARKLKEVLRESADIPENSAWAVFLRNHDELSLATLLPHDRRKIIDFADPKNRYGFPPGVGVAMRMAEMLRGDKRKILEAFELLFSMPGIPVIYYGDEIGMRNAALSGSVPDARRYVRGAFDWGEAERQMNDPGSLFSAVANMIASRRSA